MFENLPEILNIVVTSLLTQLIVAIIFPALAMGVAIKFMRNFDKN
jgi:hypothetical protein